MHFLCNSAWKWFLKQDMVVLFEIYKRNQKPLPSLAPAWKPPLEGALCK